MMKAWRERFWEGVGQGSALTQGDVLGPQKYTAADLNIF
jgi:hypothetical protein